MLAMINDIDDFLFRQRMLHMACKYKIAIDNDETA